MEIPTKAGLLHLAKHPTSRLFRNLREEHLILGAKPDEMVAFCRSKGWRDVRFETYPPAPKAILPQILLDRGPGHVWEKTKAELELAVNKHSFSTWIFPTKEAGTDKSGVLIVLVPTRPHAKVLQEKFLADVRVALATTTRKAKMEVRFVVESENEIVPPGAETVDEYSKKIAKEGTR
jgi:hypothetical protein